MNCRNCPKSALDRDSGAESDARAWSRTPISRVHTEYQVDSRAARWIATHRHHRCHHAINNNNANAGGGRVSRGDQSYIMRGTGLLPSLADLGSNRVTQVKARRVMGAHLGKTTLGIRRRRLSQGRHHFSDDVSHQDDRPDADTVIDDSASVLCGGCRRAPDAAGWSCRDRAPSPARHDLGHHDRAEIGERAQQPVPRIDVALVARETRPPPALAFVVVDALMTIG